MSRPDVSVLVVTFRSRATIAACLGSCDPGEFEREIIVVDNASDDGTADLVADQFPDVRRLRLDDNRGFGAGVNAGARLATGRHLLLLNPDAEMTTGAIDHLVRVADGWPDLGALGPRILSPDGHAELSFGGPVSLWGELRQQGRNLLRRSSLGRRRLARGKTAAPAWLSAACLLVPRPAFDRVGGFDEGFFLYFEDVDLCTRLGAAGLQLSHDPAAEARHLRGGSAASDRRRVAREYRLSQLRYYRKHRSHLEVRLLCLYLGLRFRLELARASVTGNIALGEMASDGLAAIRRP